MRALTAVDAVESMCREIAFDVARSFEVLRKTSGLSPSLGLQDKAFFS
jgi:hypothetical protein